jgi:uncharacterized protein YodC (DUF2158 family)
MEEMTEFKIGDVVRVSGQVNSPLMTVEGFDPEDVVRTVWFDTAGYAHRDWFPAATLVRP